MTTQIILFDNFSRNIPENKLRKCCDINLKGVVTAMLIDGDLRIPGWCEIHSTGYHMFHKDRNENFCGLNVDMDATLWYQPTIRLKE